MVDVRHEAGVFCVITTRMHEELSNSKETHIQERRLARIQGKAFSRALEHMVYREADQGSIMGVDDYIIGYAVEEAGGLYVTEESRLVWKMPEAENAHIEIVVADGRTGQFLPYCTVTVTVIDEAGTVVGRAIHEFLLHPWLYHYGKNWVIERRGTYALKVEVTPPQANRHDQLNGNRLSRPVTVLFEGVRLPIGREE